MNGILRCLLGSLFILSLILNDAGAAGAKPRQIPQIPNNVLLITVDTLRADRLGCYGSRDVATPNIDRLASGGVLFSRAFAHTPLTLPSHANILLGTTPLKHGVHNNVDFIVREEETTLAEHLNAAGYTTAAFVGGFPLDSRFGLAQGFDVYDDDFKPAGASRLAPGERRAEEVIGRALAWIRKTRRPWFVWVHLYDPHVPYDPPPPFRTEYRSRPYDGEVAYTDMALGPLLAEVDRYPARARTVVLFTSDHGESLGEHGEKTHGLFAYNSTLWVPLILRVPGLKIGRIDQPAGHTDIFPTVTEALGMGAPDGLQGVSLLPVMNGRPFPPRKIYFESLVAYTNYGLAPLRGYTFLQRKFIESPIPELYDIGNDFAEGLNLARGTNLSSYRSELERTVRELSGSDAGKAANRPSAQTLRMMKSLGYLGGGGAPLKELFEKEYDVKNAVPAIELAEDLFLLSDTSEAIRKLRDLSSRHLRIYHADLYLAQLLERTGRGGEALSVLAEARDRYPESYEIFAESIRFLVETGRFEEALRVMEGRDFLRMSADPEIWKIRGQALLATGDLAGAIQALERAASIDPGYGDVFENLGNAYFSIFLGTEIDDFYSSALYHLKKAIDLDPDSLGALHSLGAVYLSGKDYDGAIRSFERVIKLSSNFKKARFYLGYAYLNKGQWEKARTELVTYKNMYYSRLTPEEMASLDGMITATYTRHIH